MLTFSLLLNLGVLIPVCLGMAWRAAWARDAYGPPSAAHGILLSVYGAIAALSLLLLLRPSLGWGVPLLTLQVLYKVQTPFWVGTWRHPLVLSNLAISAVHLITLTRLGLWDQLAAPL